MAYTVKKLSELSGVTVRTLHFYEEIGLLKPAYHGSNGYRYYEERELLQLQQILFFKELGFTLKQIQKVLGRSDFDQLAALASHRKALTREWEKIGFLLKTIDKTIKHLKGKKKMKDKEMFDGFNITLVKAKEGQSYSAAEKIVVQSVKNPTKNAEDVEKRGKAYYDNITKTANALFKELVHCLEKGLDPAADEVQKIIKRHHAFAEQTHSATKEVYKAMAQLYAEHPEFRKQLDPFHPELATLMAAAMRIFADRKLS
ncbi:MAG TPA: MerR family transcriptional regulator [Rhabdochlamydiaceae bacterium]|nr:MerR family transcriptional regulator [Rhabdochlamydiaceae bacterium]